MVPRPVFFSFVVEERGATPTVDRRPDQSTCHRLAMPRNRLIERESREGSRGTCAAVLVDTMMKTSLSLISIIAAVGCGSSSGGPDDPIDPTNPDNPDLPVPQSPEGRFNVQREMDLASSMPGMPGTVVNYFIRATDDPDDPTKFIVEQIINSIGNAEMKAKALQYAPLITGYLN